MAQLSVVTTPTLNQSNRKWWNNLSTLHIQFDRDRVRLNGEVKRVQDVLNNIGNNLSGDGLEQTTSSSALCDFSDYTWLTSADEGTIVVRYKTSDTSNDKTVFGVNETGVGVYSENTDGAKFVSDISPNVTITQTSDNYLSTDNKGISSAISWDSFGQSIVIGDKHFSSSTSTVSPDFSTLSIGTDTDGNNPIEGHILEFFYIPSRLKDTDLFGLVDPSGYSGNGYDILLDSSLSSNGNTYDGLDSLNTAQSRLIKDMKIGIAKGSQFFGEAINVTTGVEGLTIIPVGTGDTPEIFGHSIESTWTAHATESNVWQLSQPHVLSWPESGSNTFLTVFRSQSASSTVSRTDIPHKRYGSLQEVVDNQNSFYVDYTAGIVYLRTHDDSNPNTNGLAYSTTKTSYMMRGFDHLEGFDFFCQGWDDGVSSIYMKDINAYYGVNHNFLGPGKAGVLTQIINCDSYNCQQRLNSSGQAPFIFYSSVDTSNGELVDYLVQDCRVIQEETLDDVIGNANCGSFGAHSNSGNVINSITMERCSSTRTGNSTGALSFADTINLTIDQHTMIGARRILPIGNKCKNVSITRSYFGSISGETDYTISRGIYNGGDNAKVKVHGNVFQTGHNSGGMIWCNQASEWDIQYNTVDSTYVVGFAQRPISISNTEAKGIIRNNVIKTIHYYFEITVTLTAANWAIDHNFYNENEEFRYLNVSRQFSAWRTLWQDTEENYDSLSSQGDPGFTVDTTTWDSVEDAITSNATITSMEVGAEYYVHAA